MSTMLSWHVGRVKITRIVEMDLPVPIAFMPQATSAELRKSTWLYPHFVGENVCDRSAGVKHSTSSFRRPSHWELRAPVLNFG